MSIYSENGWQVVESCWERGAYRIRALGYITVDGEARTTYRLTRGEEIVADGLLWDEVLAMTNRRANERRRK